MSHVGDTGGIEAFQAKVCQAGTGTEHLTHIGYRAGLQVFQALHLRQVAHTIEPAARVGGNRMHRGAVDHHLSHFQLTGKPCGVTAVIIRQVDVARFLRLLAIGIERQRAVLEDNVEIEGHVAWIARAAVGAGILLVGVVGGERCASAAHQTVTVVEHTRGFGHAGCRPC